MATDIKPQAEKTKQLEFDFIKSSQFRVIHVDGVWGGLGPRQFINMAVYAERNAIPQSISYDISDQNPSDGIRLEAATPDTKKARNAIIREVEANLVIDISTADGIATWLREKVDQAIELGLYERHEEIEGQK